MKLGTALRQELHEGYGARDLRSDLMAGAVVGIVALPLSMALAIASGVPPQHGLYTAIVAGSLIPLLGGSRVQVSGPTAAFVVILAPIASRLGLGGLLSASFLAGLLLLIMGAAGMGRFIEFVPDPVTTGFTAGIAVVIGTLQLKDFLGLSVERIPEHYLERLGALVQALPTARVPDFLIGALTLALLLLSAVVADGMTGKQHDPDAELVAQGVGNLVAPFFGGIAATGAIARTATNVRAGGRSPVAAVFHAVFVLVAVLLLAPLLGYLPMASLAAPSTSRCC